MECKGGNGSDITCHWAKLSEKGNKKTTRRGTRRDPLAGARKKKGARGRYGAQGCNLGEERPRNNQTKFSGEKQQTRHREGEKKRK